ncbi:MAG: UDP-N-acetylmuramoyl-L-alanyl-D-glutamate--2,6-diaminopimelate ligase [Clostridia bacterium]|nr:UDP-N-acetylmuramoyl-L-alanyl-D-glutamate--2,6-diaminopimelate ligase [Clostridia bacterium]MBQ5833868.1 UDP-N-acetylmuramoyl-L-alanyl-D-glutamate--2,6-diaminopimelate ligase [Clostridia bacterium]
MKLGTLCRAAGIELPLDAEDLTVTSVETDSRKTIPGSLFICIRGLHTDSHQCIPDAIAKGASVILTEKGASFPPPGGDVLLLAAEDTRRASAFLYHAWYGFPGKDLKLIGVTGTNGKTSITHMLRHILESCYLPCGLIGTLGCESRGRPLESASGDALANMTTPDPQVLYRLLAQMEKDGVEYVVMEVSSHALALGKLAPLHFALSIFTNLTQDHLDFHKTMEAYADAKASLFAQSRCSVLCIDSPYAERMRRQGEGRVVTCSSASRNADYSAFPLSGSGREGVQYRLEAAHLSLRLFCPILGHFSITNSMQAAVAAMELGIRPTRVKEALASLPGIKGRMERVPLGVDADFTVLIDYAHTPDALENLLRTAREICGEGERIVLLFGCGGNRDAGKRPIMGRIACAYADFVILTSDNSRDENSEDILAQILSGMDLAQKRIVIPDRKQAIEYAILHAEKGDLILLAGKGHEEYEISRGERKRFSEREIVEAALLARRRRSDRRQDASYPEDRERHTASERKESDLKE